MNKSIFSERSLNINPHSESVVVSESVLKRFCSKNNLPYKLITLAQLHSDSPSRYAFVFTGDKADKFNGGYHNHWLFLLGSHLFDSYSYQKHYNLPEWCEPVALHPAQLQAFGSNVCGEYCCTFYQYSFDKSEQDSLDEIGLDYCNEYGFTNERDRNDKIVLEAFKQLQ